MNTSFQYCILQYKHSIVLGEAINVGIIFHFPDKQLLYFAYGNASRVRSIYPDFDHAVFSILLKSIEKKLKTLNLSLFKETIATVELSQLIRHSLLSEDASVLQFSNTFSGLNTFGDTERLINEFTRLLLPGIDLTKAEQNRHSEYFLTRRFVDYINKKDKSALAKFSRNYTVESSVNNNPVSLKFDYAWRNGTFNLVKPISFDLSDEKGIQDKAALNIGYLNLLGNFAQSANARFDLLIAQPQTKVLYHAFDRAIGLIEETVKSPKKIVLEDQLEEYTEEAIAVLSN